MASDYPPNLLIPHGFEANYTIGFARGLAENGVPVEVISSDEIASQLDAVGISHSNLRGSQDPGRRAWHKAISLFCYYLRLWIAIFHYRGRTIHFIGILTPRLALIDGLLLPAWLRLCAGRYIHTAHNTLPHGRDESTVFRLVYRWAYRFPHVIVVHTQAVGRQLEAEFGVSRDRICVISIGLNEEVPSTPLTTLEARRALSLPPFERVVLFFGKIEPYKGVDLLIQAWDAVRADNALLCIVGCCPHADYARRLREQIAASSKAWSIEWREGFIQNDAVAVWLRACDFVVMPYRHIYQSGVIFLCLRFGVPMVATDVGSLKDFVDESSGVICNPNDPRALAAGLDCVLADPDRFDRGSIARKATIYRWAEQCARITSLYGRN